MLFIARRWRMNWVDPAREWPDHSRTAGSISICTSDGRLAQPIDFQREYGSKKFRSGAGRSRRSPRKPSFCRDFFEIDFSFDPAETGASTGAAARPSNRPSTSPRQSLRTDLRQDRRRAAHRANPTPSSQSACSDSTFASCSRMRLQLPHVTTRSPRRISMKSCAGIPTRHPPHNSLVTVTTAGERRFEIRS